MVLWKKNVEDGCGGISYRREDVERETGGNERNKFGVEVLRKKQWKK